MKSLHPVMLLEGIKRSIVTYTRLPLRMVWNKDKPHTAPVSFLPFIGLLVALISAWPLFIPAFDYSLMALFMLLTAVLLTGAFHEDGFMDSLDGLIGGVDKEQRLTIMKDSRLGSYAAIGIWFLLSMKWLLLTKLMTLLNSPYLVLFYWSCIHVLARITPILIMHRLPYVSLGKSKAKRMLAKLKVSEWGIVCIPIIALVLACKTLNYDWYTIAFLCFFIVIFSVFCIYYFKNKIQGFNGDALGASEQISECGLLFFLVIYFTSV